MIKIIIIAITLFSLVIWIGMTTLFIVDLRVRIRKLENKISKDGENNN